MEKDLILKKDIAIIRINKLHTNYRFDKEWKCKVFNGYTIYDFEDLEIKINDGVFKDQHGKIYPISQINKILADDNNRVKVKTNKHNKIYIDIEMILN